MIDVIKYDDDGSLPVSIIVPLSKKREKFFYDMVFPMLEVNMVKEIIINNNNGLAPKKRNDGFDKSTQPYIFFCDDDVVLPASHIENLYNALINTPEDIGYTYSGYRGIVLESKNHPIGKNFQIQTRDFNTTALKNGNYISTMSLQKRKYFPRFDESLKRLQDYDIWLTLLRKNIKGLAVHNNEFYAYYLDEGITSNTNNERDGLKRIYEKHKLGTW